MQTSDQARTVEPKSEYELHTRSLLTGTLVYFALLVVLSLIARFFHLKALDEYPLSTFIAFAILFAPYWLFGFGLAPYLRRVLAGRLRKPNRSSTLAGHSVFCAHFAARDVSLAIGLRSNRHSCACQCGAAGMAQACELG